MPGPHATLLHRTSYAYERPVQLGPQVLRLHPLPDPRHAPPAYTLAIDPAPLSLHWIADPLGNHVARFALPGPVRRLSIAVTLGLDLSPRNPFDFILDPAAINWPFTYLPEDADALLPYRRTDHPGPLLTGLHAETTGMHPTVELMLALTARVRDLVAYEVRMEAGVWPPDRTLAEARGSCRDSAWLLVQLMRMHGVAARFVSGYLVQLPEDGGAPVAELHAWADAYLPGAGWIGFDATSGLLTAEGHVPLAASPDPLGAAPLTGTSEPAEAHLTTDIAVQLTP